MAYYRLEPFGEERADLRNAMLMALISNAFGNDSTVSDFMPRFDGENEDETDIVDKAKSIFGMMARTRRPKG